MLCNPCLQVNSKKAFVKIGEPWHLKLRMLSVFSILFYGSGNRHYFKMKDSYPYYYSNGCDDNNDWYEYWNSISYIDVRENNN